ncbi:MAG: winged helix DNA-binding domain-containing protein, partial [Bacteroidales bacterium]|nr:winged helix DNA-binding domain-containing protein [Bacteroidales bacterium]
SLQDFVWWSGLSVSNARQAIHNIQNELVTDKFAGNELFVHRSCGEKRKSNGHVLHFLPSFDEYLISYKDRTSVLDLEHHPKAFTKNGIFHPVIIYDGKVVGTWKKTVKKGLPDVEAAFFEQIDATKEQTELAANKYKAFLINQISLASGHVEK